MMNARIKDTIASPVAAVNEPLTLAEAKLFCEIPSADITKDDLIFAYIAAAREVAEMRQGRDLVEKQWDVTMDYIPEVIQCRENLSSVELFQYKNSDGVTTVLSENTDFIVDTDSFLIQPPYGESWPSFTPWPSSAVLVRYTVTPPQVHARVLIGIKFLISQWYVNRVPAELGASAVQIYPFTLDQLDYGRVASA